jgi:hypothetical protein
VSWRKPSIGDLVKLDDLAVAERGYMGNPVGQVGVIIKCVGIRCHVQWDDGEVTKPERTVLEVINYASR